MVSGNSTSKKPSLNRSGSRDQTIKHQQLPTRRDSSQDTLSHLEEDRSNKDAQDEHQYDDEKSSEKQRNDNNYQNDSHQSQQNNEKKDCESQRDEPPRTRFAAAIQTFSPIWFAIVMNTGILGLIIHQSPEPYNGHWMRICSYILYVTALILYFSFMFIYLLRAILYPRSIPGPSRSQPPLSVETTASAACMPIATSTLIAQTILIVSRANWNGTGRGFMLFCYCAWWCVVVWILVTAQSTLVNSTRKEYLHHNQLPPACIIPGVGMVTTALTGAVVVTYGEGVTAGLATPAIIVGYIMLGYGLFWALFMYPIFLYRLLDVGWPAAEQIPALVFLAGPPGQAAGALVAHGAAAEKYFPQYQQNSELYTSTATQSLSSVSILGSFAFLGLYALWLVFAICGILEVAFQGKLKKFTFIWWGTIFPTATGGLGFMLLANALDSEAFSILGLIWLVVLLVDYFTCWYFTIVGIIKGDFLDGRSEEEKEARMKLD